MKYKIKVEYTTGDSFGSEDTCDILEETWTNLDIAKENIQRIKEHYKWYQSEHDYYKFIKEKDKTPQPEFGVIINDVLYCIKLKLDNGEEWQFYPSWIGYFESLNSVEIIPDIEGMRIDLK